MCLNACVYVCVFVCVCVCVCVCVRARVSVMCECVIYNVNGMLLSDVHTEHALVHTIKARTRHTHMH